MIRKIVNSILALLFLLFAFVQINDPDPLMWILIYLNMVALCVMVVLNKFNKLWVSISAGLYLVYAIILIPGAMVWFRSPDKALLFDDLAKMQYPYIEETREFLGLVICLLVLGFQFFASRK